VRKGFSGGLSAKNIIPKIERGREKGSGAVCCLRKKALKEEKALKLIRWRDHKPPKKRTHPIKKKRFQKSNKCKRGGAA